MAFFAVEKRKISKVWPHPNADRLDLASVEGMTVQFVSQKGTQVEGGEVIYFPIDSVIPEPLADFLNIKNMLSGGQRIRTVKLRGENSQGLVIAVDRIKEYLKVDEIPENLTEALGVTKYDPPVIFASATANLVPLPPHVYYYDIEGAERNPQIVEMLMDQEVWVSEKMEGTNFGVSINADGVIVVNQHGKAIQPKEGTAKEDQHTFIKASQKAELDIVLNKLQNSDFPNKSITIRGELVGPSIQKNIYGLKDHKIFVFDVDVNGRPLSVDEMAKTLFGEERIEFVPTIFRGKLRDFLAGRTVMEASNGKSLINKDVLREGIVIKPIVEDYVQGFGRLFIKQRSPDYLAKEKD